MRGFNFWELGSAVLLCGAIIIATMYYLASQTPIQEVIATETKEADLIKAIYIDEYARNFIKFGMKFILQDGMEKLSERGGVISNQLTQSNLKGWVNITNLTGQGIRAASINPDTGSVDKDKALPMSREDDVVYYRWCNQTLNDQCVPITIDTLSDEDDRLILLLESIKNSFSLTSYLSKFSRYTQMYPEITPETTQITLTDSSASVFGKFRVVIRVGGYAGVNSSEVIGASVSSEILQKVEAATEFVQSNGFKTEIEDLQNKICPISRGTLNATTVEEAFSQAVSGLDVGTVSYSQKANATIWVFGQGSGQNAMRCLTADTLHVVDGDFRFRTEVRKCVASCP